MSWFRRLWDKVPAGGTGYMAARLAASEAAQQSKDRGFREGGPVENTYTLIKHPPFVWVVCQWVSDTEYEIQGVYSSEGLANQNALVGWAICPLLLDTPTPLKTTEWPRAYVALADGLSARVVYGDAQ